MADHLNTTFTPFWVSTIEARKRTGRHQYKHQCQQKREWFYDPDQYMKIVLPRAQSRFRSPIRRQNICYQEGVALQTA